MVAFESVVDSSGSDEISEKQCVLESWLLLKDPGSDFGDMDPLGLPLLRKCVVSSGVLLLLVYGVE